MKRYGIIYLIVNNIDKKVYVGQTIFTFDKRYQNNLEKYTCNDHLRRAIRKYGIDNFTIMKQFDIAFCKEELDELEKYYIKLFNANNKKFGYNYMSGGHNGKHNEESKRKIGIKQVGELNHMYGKYGRNNPKYSRIISKCDICGKEIDIQNCRIDRGKHHYCSNECRHAGQSKFSKQANKKTFVCENCGKEFLRYDSENVGKKHIYCSRECQNEAYKTRYSGKNNPNYRNGDKVSGGLNGRAKKVICIDTGEIFECSRDAEKKYNIARGCVAACCRGEQKTSNNYRWKYI